MPLLTGCGATTARRAAAPPATATSPAGGTPAPAPAPPHLCRARRGRTLGRIRDPAMDELSGLARARRAPGVLFAEEDSGNPPVLTALRAADGTVLGHVSVTGARNVDWEDLAAGRGPDGRPLLYVADIGDNGAQRRSVQVYRVAEPAPTAGTTAPAARLDLRYPDGAHDAEALLADPLRHELLIVTKSLAGGRVYAVPRGAAPGVTATLRHGPGVPLAAVTAGDVSGDGRIVALRTYDTLAVWRRRGREPLTVTLDRAPACAVPAGLDAEGTTGEALALDRHGRTALTAPEGTEPRLSRHG